MTADECIDEIRAVVADAVENEGDRHMQRSRYDLAAALIEVHDITERYRVLGERRAK